jgi:aryl-alcohol dehydrogenase-like predicted oxidoreductase
MAQLATRALGSTGMQITTVGFGAWAIGGGDWAFSWGPQDDADSIAAIRHAVSLGINWIDTAAVYGLGHSEEVVAAALDGLPEADRPFVFTKCGMVWNPADRSQNPERIASPESIRRELEQSLKRLRVERIDLYQLHWPPADGTPIEVYWQCLLDLEREGKIRAAALSNHNVEMLEAAESLGHVAALQPPFSMINRRAAADVLPWCAEHSTGVIVYSPMASGLLTGAFGKARVESLAPDDWRRRSPEFGENLEKNLALADALRPIAEARDTTQSAIAITWTLAFEGVSGAIVGARSAEQIDGWIDASSIELSQGELDQIAEAIDSTGAGAGPSAPR